MKRLMYTVAALLIAACAPANKDATGTAESTATTATTASVAPPPAPAPKAPEEKPLSYYQDKVAELHTAAGEIDIRFFPDVAPNHVRNFIDLSEKGFYNGTKFHRVIPGFVIQGGDPNTISGDVGSWGTGGSGKHLNAEFNSIHHSRGILSMARSADPNSASSQFFICVADAPNLDNQYTVFGQVTKGMDVVDKIVSAPREMNYNRPDNPIAIESVKVRPATAEEKAIPHP